MTSDNKNYFISKMVNVLTFSKEGVDVDDPVELKKIHAKVEIKIKSIIDGLRSSHGKFEDSDFGPTESDPYGAKSLYGSAVPNPAGHSKYPAPETLRWDRPVYEDKKFDENGKEIVDGDDEEEDEEVEDEFAIEADEEESFCSHGKLFIDGSTSGDVVQGQLGDCWFLGALAVMATNDALLEKCFYRLDDFQEYGMFVCVFHKDCQLVFVIIDDRIPVVSRTNKVVFAHCKDPNELWVPLIEKAYAKLFGCYKALIGGYSHYALADMTGFCPRLVGLKPGYMGYSNDITDESLWFLLRKYKMWGSLMACSIQSNPKQKSKVEADAGGGLYMGHAYSLLDCGEVKIESKAVRLLKLRNPWGKGEWTGAWSDTSEEVVRYAKEINAVFNVGIEAGEELELENASDGTFLISFADWRARYTSLFVAINFPTKHYVAPLALQGLNTTMPFTTRNWIGKHIRGKWDGEVGGNRNMGTWVSNPKVKLKLKDTNTSKNGYYDLFIGLYINDSRLSLGFDYFKVGWLTVE